MNDTASGPTRAGVGVIGIGNLLLRDEGFGVHALRALAGELEADGVRLIDGGTDPWSALSAAEGCRVLVVLDAVVGGKAPGECHALSLDEVEMQNAAMSLHGLTLFHLLRYEKLLGDGPERVRVLGMEPDVVEAGMGLSDCCRQSMPAFIRMAKDEIRAAQGCAAHCAPA